MPWETTGWKPRWSVAECGVRLDGRSFEDFWNFGPQKGELSVVEFVGKNSPNPDKQIYKDDWNNFGPAIGFSWQLPWFGRAKQRFAADTASAIQAEAADWIWTRPWVHAGHQ